MGKKSLFSSEMKRLQNPSAYAVDRTFSVSDVNGRDRNLIEKVYSAMDTIAYQQEWEQYWSKKGLKEPDNSTPNRKFIYDAKEWTYGSPHETTSLDISTINQFVSLALENVKVELTRKSKLLSTISPDNLRYLIEKFSDKGVF